MMTDGHRKLTLERPIAATPAAVYDALLDPLRIGRWMFRTPGGVLEAAELTPEVGGSFTIIERRGAAVAPHYGTLRALERPKRLVFDFAVAEGQPPTEVEIALKDSAFGALVRLTHTVETRWAEYAPMILAGWSRVLASLSALLAVENGRRLSTAALIDAPAAEVWRQWTETDRLRVWWGGPQAPRPVVEALDAVAGGGFRLVMPAPEGPSVTLDGVYREVVPGQSLTYDARCHAGSTLLYEELIEVALARSGKSRTIVSVAAPLSPATLQQPEAGLDDLRITWARVWSDSLDALADAARQLPPQA